MGITSNTIERLEKIKNKYIFISKNKSKSNVIPKNINNKSPKPIYLFTENNDIKPYLMNDENNDFTKIKIPTNNINLSRNSFIKKFPRTNDSRVLKHKINKSNIGKNIMISPLSIFHILSLPF